MLAGRLSATQGIEQKTKIPLSAHAGSGIFSSGKAKSGTCEYDSGSRNCPALEPVCAGISLAFMMFQTSKNVMRNMLDEAKIEEHTWPCDDVADGISDETGSRPIGPLNLSTGVHIAEEARVVASKLPAVKVAGVARCNSSVRKGARSEYDSTW